MLKMKRFVLVVVLFAACMAVCSCRTRDMRTVTISLPGMKNEQCRKVIEAALAKTEGIDPAQLHFADRSVTVTYDSMKIAVQNIESAIADAGFMANETAADADARQALPLECR